MSIAVSAVVRPSRLLRALVLAFALAQLAAGLAIASALGPPLRFPLLAACACLACATLLLRGLARPEMTHQIDISGLGDLRLTVQLDRGENAGESRPVQLLAGSTVWPRMLLLRLRGEGAITVLVVLPDSVAGADFRALALAIRSISSKKNIFSGNNKIL